MEIASIDKNFVVENKIKENTKIYDVREAPFKVYGLYDLKSGGEFRRMNSEKAKAVSNGVYAQNESTSGGRIRFKTDSDYIALWVKQKSYWDMAHITAIGKAGFDMYERENGEYRYITSFPPNSDSCSYNAEDVREKGSYVSVRTLPSKKMRDITLNMPLYNDVSEMYVVLNDDAKVEESPEYTYPTPVVFYGSSITQGGCASRPGMSYANIISRHLDTDIINLGFSGNAKGEAKMAEYISNLDMSVFVYDYDYNAPDAEHLKNTHERFFKIIREKNPDLPVIMVSRPKKYLNEAEIERKHIIFDTYRNAFDSGDKNVYFIDGSEMFGCFGGEEFTVDGCHPTDLGFFRMAEVIGGKIKEILKNK